MSSESLSNLRRTKARYLRRLRIEAPRVYYFHQVDDPYSHLAVQKLDALRSQYDIDFTFCLANSPEDPYKGDAQKFDTWAKRDALSIAPYFDTPFPDSVDHGFKPTVEQVNAANASLAPVLNDASFAETAISIGAALWSDTLTSNGSSRSRLAEKGSQVRKRLGHYLSGTFYFEGEWYWGVDRLHLLEARLQEEGFGTGDLVCPYPKVSDFIQDKASSDITLEYYPSLRSPYTAIGHGRVLDLVEQTGVKLDLRPVMPMMMRGVPAPRLKQMYIITDCGRESRFYQDTFGPFCDPFGEPVKRGFAAYHFGNQQGLGLQFVTEYLKAAFAEGLDITERAGLAEVCRRAGFSLGDVDLNADWHARLEENVNQMAADSLWGVPSFKVSGGSIDEPYVCWGQDRIWRVAAEIAIRS